MKQLTIALLFLTLSCSHSFPKKRVDPLASWQDAKIKESILEYISSVTKDGENYIPPEDRIATFDNDGTLWAEKPLIQGQFSAAKAQKMGMKLEDLNLKNEKEVYNLIIKTNTGMFDDNFKEEVTTFFREAKHPTLNVPIREILYLPQLELIRLLQNHGFKVYISSGGTIEFMRAISKEYYGIPPEYVIGSSFEYAYDSEKNQIKRMPKLEFLNDKEAKPVAIQKHIGKRPVFACGNVGNAGDIHMLRFSQGSKHRTFQLLVNHDDAGREFEYGEPKNDSLNWAKKYNWNVISMKNDWKTIFYSSSNKPD